MRYERGVRNSNRETSGDAEHDGTDCVDIDRDARFAEIFKVLDDSDDLDDLRVSRLHAITIL